MLLFGTLIFFLFHFQSFIQKDFFYVNNDVYLEWTFWKLKTFEYFENKPEQLGAFKWNIHEQIYIDISSYTCYQQALSPARSVVNGKNEKNRIRSMKNEYAR